MRIGITTSEYPRPDRPEGGVGRYIQRIAQLLSERGHNVHVVAWGGDDSDEIVSGYTVHWVKWSRPRWLARLERVLLRGRGNALSCIWMDFRVRKAILKRLGCSSLDVLHVCNVSGCGAVHARVGGVPTVCFHSSYHRSCVQAHGKKRDDLHGFIMGKLELLAARRSDLSYAHSQLVQRELAKNENIRASVIKPPFFCEVKEEAFHQVPADLKGANYLLYFGSLSHLKGTDLLIDALGEILPFHPGLKVAIIGNDRGLWGSPAWNYANERLQSYRDRLVRYDPIPHDKLYPIIKSAMVTILPSRYENIPNACLEAMGLGQIVVATNGASFDEIIEDGVNGYLFRKGDAHDLAKTVNRVLNLPEEDRAKVKINAISALAPFSPTVAIVELENLIIEAISTRKRG